MSAIFPRGWQDLFQLEICNYFISWQTLILQFIILIDKCFLITIFYYLVFLFLSNGFT